MKCEKKMNYIVAAVKNMLLFVVLLMVTLLLLEVPQKLFEKSGIKLLEEVGMSEYTLKAVEKDMLLWSEKLKMLVDGESIREFIWPDKFGAEEIILEEIALADEIDIMLDEQYKFVTDELREGWMESKGFAAEIHCEIAGTEYVWSIGMLVFVGKSSGAVIYDFESKKIFCLDMYTEAGYEQERYEYAEREMQREESVMKYYEGLDVQWAEATVWLASEVEIFPADKEAAGNGILYWYLSEAYWRLFEKQAAQEFPPVEERNYND